MNDNRRQFSRILFHSEAQLLTPATAIPVNVVDISLKGALVQAIDDAYVDIGSRCTLKIHLGNDGALIHMEVTAVHHDGKCYGLACREIDLDSMTHLRRLVELNLGDETILNRELSALAN